MKYLLISAFLHGVTLVGLSLYNRSHQHLEDLARAPMIVEVLPNSFEVSQETELPKITKKSALARKKKRMEKLTQTQSIVNNHDRSDSPFVHENMESSGISESEQKQARMSYVQALSAYISQNKFYPRLARKLRQTGTVSVRVHIDSQGEFHHVHLEKGCNHKTLNSAAVKLIKQLGKFKPLPKKLGSGQDFVVPIQYRMARGS